MVYEAAPQVVAWSLVVRVAVAAIPVSMLAVTRLIIDAIDRFTTHRAPLPSYFWWLVALEFGLAGLSTVFARLIEYFDAALAARYAHHVSVRTMEHAALLDLSCYEDPVVYDKLERARVQGTDRIVMIQSAGRWVQQVITTATLAASIFFFSPWLLVALVACLVPAFLGETHYAFLGDSLNFQQTPSRRELEYLRMACTSKEGIKPVKLLASGHF